MNYVCLEWQNSVVKVCWFVQVFFAEPSFIEFLYRGSLPALDGDTSDSLIVKFVRAVASWNISPPGEGSGHHWEPKRVLIPKSFPGSPLFENVSLKAESIVHLDWTIHIWFESLSPWSEQTEPLTRKPDIYSAAWIAQTNWTINLRLRSIVYLAEVSGLRQLASSRYISRSRFFGAES